MKKFLQELYEKAQDNQKLAMAVVGALTLAIVLWVNFTIGDHPKDKQVHDGFQEPVVDSIILSKDAPQPVAIKHNAPTDKVANIDQLINPGYDGGEINLNTNDTDPLGVTGNNSNTPNSNDGFKAANSYTNPGQSSPNKVVSQVLQGVQNIEDGAKEREAERAVDSNSEKIIELLEGFAQNLEKTNKAIDSLEEKLSKINSNVHGAKSALYDVNRPNNMNNQAASKQVDSRYTGTDNSANNFTGLHIVKKKTISDTTKKAAANKSFIKVITDENKTIKNGDVVALRTLDKMIVNDREVETNTRIYAMVRFGNSRLDASVTSIVINDKEVMPIKANLFDKDGMPGIYCPSVQDVQAIRNNVAQNINSITPDGIILNNGSDVKGTLALKGVDAAFGLGKLFAAMKLTEQKVEIVSGYPLILQIENQI